MDELQVKGTVYVQLENGFSYIHGLNGPLLFKIFQVPGKVFKTGGSS